MTPKEKALELTDKYLGTIIFGVHQELINDTIPLAKQCALICVDEIQQHAQMIESEYYGYRNAYEYFKEVKQEIEAL